MVDFAEKLKQLREWKIRKQKLKCECTAEKAKTCYELDADIYDEDDLKCECECHTTEKK